MLHSFSSMSELHPFREFLPSSWIEKDGYIKLPPPHPSRVYQPTDSPLLPAEWTKDLKNPLFLEPKAALSPPFSSIRALSPQTSLDQSNTRKYLQFRSSPLHSTLSPSPLHHHSSPSPVVYSLRSSESSLALLKQASNPSRETSPALQRRSSSIDKKLSQPIETSSSSIMKKKRANFSKKTKDVLLLWLEDHLENPYPSEKDKQELARATSLSLNQVNNWFVNARRRHLWLNASTKRHVLVRRASSRAFGQSDMRELM